MQPLDADVKVFNERPILEQKNWLLTQFLERKMTLDTFRQEVRDFIDTHCPQSMRNRVVNIENSHEVYDTDDARLWLHAAAERAGQRQLGQKNLVAAA